MSILAISGVVVSTAAMIIVLSGFSGLKNYSLEFISNVSADLKISSAKGKTFVYSQEMKNYFVEKKISVAKSIEDKALISINDNSQVVLLKGIDGGFPKKNVDSLLYEGSWVGDSEVVIGWGLAYDLGISLMDGLNPITFYSPKPGRGQVFSEKDILRSRKALASGIFSLNEDLNSSLIFSDFSFAKSLFGIGENMVSSIEIYNTGIGEKDVEEIKMFFGSDYNVKNKVEQNGSLYKMLRTEQAAIFMIFSLVVIVALFNMFGALIMMVLEKRKNLKTMMILGLTKKGIGRIFLYQGWLISFAGCLIGLVLGTILLLLQKKLSLFLITPSLAYPISIELINYVVVFTTVVSLGFIASFLVSFYVKKSIPQISQ